MGRDKDDRGQSLSTAYVPVNDTVPQECSVFNTFLGFYNLPFFLGE